MAAGIVTLLVGAGVFVWSLQAANRCRPHPYVFAVAAAAAALHAYESFIHSSAGPLWAVWSFTPYALCLVISASPATRTPALAAAVMALAFDAVAHYDVFVNPRGSTVGPALLFIPLWNTIVLVPLATFVAWLFLRVRPS